MLESQIEAGMRRAIQRRGGLFYKFVSPGRPGVPDRLIVAPGGRAVFVELKAEEGRLSKLQAWQIGLMRNHGLDVRVIRGREEARALVAELFPHPHAEGGQDD